MAASFVLVACIVPIFVLNGVCLGYNQGREEQKKQRQLDLERLLQRYQNVKSELESQQNIERIRSEKFMSYHLSEYRTHNNELFYTKSMRCCFIYRSRAV